MAAWLDGEIELVCGAFSSSAEKSKQTGAALRALLDLVPRKAHRIEADGSEAEVEVLPRDAALKGVPAMAIRDLPGDALRYLRASRYCPSDRLEGFVQKQFGALLKQLHLHATRPENVYAHDWQVGDLVVFDKEVALAAGAPRQRVFGAVRFLDGHLRRRFGRGRRLL